MKKKNVHDRSKMYAAQEIFASSRAHLPSGYGSISTHSDIFANCASVNPSKRGIFDNASVIRTD